MKILSIETSCDETAISILECTGDATSAEFTVLGDALFSQAHLHAEYGGVFPTLAKREHIKNLEPLTHQALVQAGHINNTETDTSTIYDISAKKDIAFIAVTRGPGLEPALWTGIEFAKHLGEKWNIPVHGTDHMEGHIVSALVEGDGKKYTLKAPRFPILGLLISGGHTELVLMNAWFKYQLIGRTKDDAVGEAFDKVARLLGLPYPGGPKVAEAAQKSRERNSDHGIVFPRPLQHEASCDFSFSGLKTAVLYKIKEMGQISDSDAEHIAHAFEDAARDVMVIKTRVALEDTGAETLAVGGGVSANSTIRNALTSLISEEFPHVHLGYPHKTLTGDNAIMIGMAAYIRHITGTPPFETNASGTQSLA